MANDLKQLTLEQALEESKKKLPKGATRDVRVLPNGHTQIRTNLVPSKGK